MDDTDLKAFKAFDSGRPSTVSIVSGATKNVFRHVKTSEREAGVNIPAKIYFGLSNTDNAALVDPAIYQYKPTAGALNYVLMWPSAVATLVSGIEAECLASPKRYCSGTLAADITAGGQTVDILVKHSDQLVGGKHDFLRNGDIIHLTSQTTALGTTGTEEFLTILGTPTNIATLTVRVATAETIANNYVSGSAWVSSVFYADDITPSADIATLTGSVAWDQSANPLTFDNAGTMEEEYTLGFSDSTNFTCTGDSLGTLSAGTIGAEFSPVNPANSKSLFTLAANSLSGASAGDTVVVQTHAAKTPVGELLVVPASSPSLSSDNSTIVYKGESDE